MKDKNKTKQQLIDELAELRRQIAESGLAKAEGEHSGWNYEQLLDDMGDGYVMVQEGVVVYSSKRFAEIYGYDIDEVIGMRLVDFSAPENHQATLERYEGVMRGEIETSRRRESIGMKKDGTLLITESTSNIIQYKGKPTLCIVARDITKRKQAEEKYKQLIEEMNDGYLLVQDGVIVFSNKRFAEIYGYDVEEVIGKNLVDFSVPENYQAAVRRYEEVMEGRTQFCEGIEGIGVKKDGTVVITESTSKIAQYEDKLTLCIVVRDITERKQAEKALRESERRFFTAFHRNPLAMTISTLDEGRIVDINDSFLQMTGYSREELIGHTSMELNLFHKPETRAEIVQQSLDESANGVNKEREQVIRMKTGKLVTIMAWSREVVINGQPYLIGMGRDITDKKVIEEKYRQLLEEMNDGYVVVQEGKYVFCNKRFAEILGYKPRQIIGKSPDQFMMPDDRHVAIEQYGRVMGGEEKVPGLHEVVMMKKDGTPVIVESNIKLIQYENKPAAYVIIRDITDRKQTEEKYRQLLENMSDGYLVVQDGKYVFANRRYGEIFGYTPEQMQGFTIYDLPVPQDRDKMKKEYENVMSGWANLQETYVGSATKSDGTEIIVEASIRPSEYEGRPALTIIARDITDRKQAEEKYRQLLENMNDGYLVIQDEKYVFANRQFCEMFRCKPDQVAGKDLIYFLNPDDHQAVMKQYEKMLIDNIPIQYEGQALRSDGTTFMAEAIIKGINYEGRPAIAAVIRDITQRKQAEQGLRESEELFFTAFHQNPTAMAISSGPEGCILDANDSFLHMIEYTREEVIGHTSIELNIFKGQAERDQMVQELISENIHSGRELVICTKTGKLITIISWATEVTINGQPHIITMAVDITERKQMEEVLRESEEKYRNLVERASDGVCILQDGLIKYANSRQAEMWGGDVEELIDTSFVDYIHSDSRSMAVERYKQRMAGERVPSIYELNLMRKDNSRIEVELNIGLISYLGSPAELVITRDITERKKAEAILRESEEKLRLIFESVAEGIILCDLKGNILDINNGLVHMHGYDTKEDLIGRNCNELIVERDHGRVKEGFKKRIKKGTTGVLQYIFVRKDGSEFPVAASAAVLRDAERKPRGFVIITTDITEQQKIQEQLMLADRLASIGQLAAGIAHELNNPLAGVVGISKLLLEKDVPDEVKADLELIDREATRAANVVRGLLTFARGKGTEKVMMNINSVIREVLQLRSYEQRVSNIEVETEFASDLPNITFNGAQMQQVFINIVVNAEQAMLGVRREGRLKIKTERVGDSIKISVADDGPGISPENMKKLFNPFFTTKDVGKGTGLGLSICHGIITEHGGRMYAESEMGKGACFIIELPINASGGE